MAILPKSPETKVDNEIAVNPDNKNKSTSKTDREKRLTMSPLEMLPPKRIRVESEQAVESLKKTEFTFIFSLNTNHGYGIFVSLAFTEFYGKKKLNVTNFQPNCNVRYTIINTGWMRTE